MLKILSYLNIALSIVYFMTYLLNSYSWPIVAILLLIIYNGLIIRNVEKESGFNAVHYVLGAFCLFFAGFLILWMVNIIASGIASHYFKDVWMYVALSGPFALSIVAQFTLLLTSRRSS
jgi:hypothetical protein